MKVNLFLLLLLVVVLIFVGLGCQNNTEVIKTSQNNMESSPALGQVPDFQLESATGGTVSPQQMRGKVWILAFIFTHCPGVCVPMTKNLKQVQDAFIDESDFRIVTITVDPERDTPERLIQFAKEHGADLGRWLFLRGDKQYVFDLSTEGFKLSAYEVPSKEPGGQSGFVHSERFMLIDRNGLIRQSFRGTQNDDVLKLIDYAKQLLRVNN